MAIFAIWQKWYIIAMSWKVNITKRTVKQIGQLSQRVQFALRLFKASAN